MNSLGLGMETEAGNAEERGSELCDQSVNCTGIEKGEGRCRI